ncbi:MAG: TIGR03905 family TSCPD domain-containing protein [Oscillospiraceae bacterium]|nr:TIGR03905 family TSCPD domain-containing protein [Oscillospiraceae bacterium]
MRHSYRTKDVCATKISFDLDGDVVRNIVFTGGCSGNLQALQKLLEGFTVEQIATKLAGTTCGRRPTSCADQLANAVQAAYEKTEKKA